MILSSLYPVELSCFEHMPVKVRPVYIFRRASNTEFMEDSRFYDAMPKMKTKEEIIEASSKRIKLRLIKVYVDYDFDTETGTECPQFMDFVGTLDLTQLAELFPVMHMAEVMNYTSKKKFNSRFTIDSEDSATVATPPLAKGRQGKVRKSRKSPAQSAGETPTPAPSATESDTTT